MVIKVSDSVENGRKVASSSSKYRDDSVWMCHCFKGYCVPCLNRTEKFARCLRVCVGLLGTVCLLPRVCGIGSIIYFKLFSFIIDIFSFRFFFVFIIDILFILFCKSVS